MVATVGSIAIDMIVNAAKFVAGFKGAATTVDRESKRMSTALGGIQSSLKNVSGLASAALGGVGAFAGLTSLTALVGRARDAIAQLDDIADRAKSSGLGTDLLQSLEHGAQQAGIEVATLSGGLTFFAKGMGQAAEGTGRLYSMLLKLNPELLRAVLNADSQEERLKAVADALDQTRTATERAALSAALFGDVDFARLFEGGAESINKMVEAMDGKLFTPEQIAQASAYDAKLNDISKNIDTNLNRSFLNLGPYIVAAAEALDHFIEVQSRMSGGIGPALDRIGQAFGLLGDRIGDLFTRDFAAEIADVQAEILATKKRILELPPMDFQTTLAKKQLADLQYQLFDLQQQLKADNELKIDTSAANAALSEVERRVAGFKASMAADVSLPRVHGGGNAVDPDIMDDVENAIDKNTNATYITGRAIRDAVQSSGASVAAALSYRVPAGGGYATGDSANSFKFSGLGGSSSWGGRRMTFGGGGGGSSEYTAGRFGGPINLLAARAGGMGAAAVPDASSISSGATAAVNVNIVVKPILTGERLSVQSRAEIKQAAAEGTNAALRAYNGR